MVAIVTIIGSFYTSPLTSWLTAAVMTLAIAIAIDWKCRGNSKMKKKYKLPPGPKGVPILGVFPTLLKAPAHIVFEGTYNQVFAHFCRHIFVGIPLVV